MRYLTKPLPEEGKIKDFLGSMRWNRSHVSYETKWIDISECMLGYCVRLFPVPDRRNYRRDDFQYHADCILPRAGLASYGFDPIDNLGHMDGPRGRWEKGLSGEVKFNGDNLDKFYDSNIAARNRCITLFLILRVSNREADNFKRFWKQPAKNYNRFSNNCSSVPYAALLESGIFPKHLMHPITPQRLYHHMRNYFREDGHSHVIEGYGFLGVDFLQGKLEIRIPKGLR